ncbi:hypothetical protein SOHN41_03329 [Shewanella sp. HN-41]|nr:hypothetical protein SOHN41_03329 [Shewanella sp. HN-41]
MGLNSSKPILTAWPFAPRGFLSVSAWRWVDFVYLQPPIDRQSRIFRNK